MATPATFDLTGDFAIYRGDTWGPHAVQIGRGVTDAAVTLSSDDLYSATAQFGAGDVGATVGSYTVAGGVWTPSTLIPAGATILSVDSGTDVTLSAVAADTQSDVAVKIGAKDLTGYTFLAQIRRGWTNPDVLAAVTVTVTDLTSGTFDLSLSPSLAATIPPGDAVWDLQSSMSGVVETWLRGNVTVLPDSSRP